VKLLPGHCLGKGKVKMGQQLLVSKVEQTRALVSEYIGNTRDKIMKGYVSVMALVEGVEPEQVCDGT
jgi:hypothetical protein